MDNNSVALRTAVVDNCFVALAAVADNSVVVLIVAVALLVLH